MKKPNLNKLKREKYGEKRSNAKLLQPTSRPTLQVNLLFVGNAVSTERIGYLKAYVLLTILARRQFSCFGPAIYGFLEARRTINAAES